MLSRGIVIAAGSQPDLTSRVIHREQLSLDVLKCLELECVAGWVQKKHRGLFAGLTAEACARLDHELDACPAQPRRQFEPLLRPEHDAAVGHGHAVPVHEVEMARELAGCAQFGVQVTDELVSIEIEINPARIAAALGTTEDILVETARLGDVAHLHGDVERCQRLVQEGCRTITEGHCMFLLRHGQSYFNLHFSETRVDPGIEDPELTPLGAEQAAAAARQLAGAALTRIIVSPYTRALQTAQPVLAIHRVPVDIMHEVRERAAFVCDVGSPPELLTARFPHHDFAHLPRQWWHEGIESAAATKARRSEERRVGKECRAR